jgi:hypothetical protein
MALRGGGLMALAFVQDGDTGATFINSGSAGDALPANNTIGNCVAVMIGSLSGTVNDVSGVSSSMGTFTKVDAIGGDVDVEFWVCRVTTGAARTITVTTTSGDQWVAVGFEYSGGVGSAVSGGSGSGTSASASLAVTPDESGDVVMVASTVATAFTGAPSSPWSSYNAGGWTLSEGAGLAAQIVSSGSAVTATWTVSGSHPWTTLGLILRPSASPKGAMLAVLGA